jgi:hypothetical protein
MKRLFWHGSSFNLVVLSMGGRFILCRSCESGRLGAAFIWCLLAGLTLTVMQAGAAVLVPNPVAEPPASGIDSVLLTNVPATNSWTATAIDPWLHLSATNQSGTGSSAIVFTFDANPGPRRVGTISIADATLSVIQGGSSYTLGTTSLAEGPAGGSDSIILAGVPPVDPWTATSSVPWLHLSVPQQSGAGSTILVFAYDPNSGPTRTGTLTIAGLKLNLTQAPSNYTQVTSALPALSLPNLASVGVDTEGNVYTIDYANKAVKKWAITNGVLTTLFTSADQIHSLAVDPAENVYTESYYGASYPLPGGARLQKWTKSNGNLSTLINGMFPYVSFLPENAVGLDHAGNVYAVDAYSGTVQEWVAAGGTSATLDPADDVLRAAAVDLLGDVTVGTESGDVLRWVNNTWTYLATFGTFGNPEREGLAMDGSGNAYMTDYDGVYKWSATYNSLARYASTASPHALAIDASRNLYVVASDHNLILKLPYAFLDITAKFENMAAGSDSLPAVVPATQNLTPPFFPTSDASWLTVTSVTNGVVSFSFGGNSGPTRIGHINVLGQPITVTQQGSPQLFPGRLPNGAFQFSFTNNPAITSFTIVTSTNLSLPLSNWSVAGPASNIGSGVFQFMTQPATNAPKRFYRVRWP